MAKQREQESSIDAVQIPLSWTVPENIVARYATNLVVQRLENEFLISFFEVKPPILFGNPEQVIEQAKGIDQIKAVCIAQIFIATEKMPEFLRALQEKLNPNNQSSES